MRIETEPIHSMKILVVALVWFLLALLIGASGLLASIPPPFQQAFLFSLVIVLLLLFWRSFLFREWLLSVDIRVLVLIHLSRFVGIYFLVLYSRGDLPYAFAVPGGWGDIAVAATAIPVSLFLQNEGAISRRILFLWNVFGLVDILLVIATASRLAMANPESMVALTRLPLSLLPTFLVPIIVFTHIIIFVRLLTSRRKIYRMF
ncbi:MAG TPA: hypothetical protein VHT73_12080 [Thermodesulfobacteriota bacterium]|nr:hypothetical protein [Thermodesulfobacteriota bacterium]